MGAYYTKEDITDYISKNCIIPWLFDEVKRQYPKAFANDGWLWQMLKTSGDEYIYDAVKHGVPDTSTGSATAGLFDDLPEEITKGFAPALEKKLVDGKEPYLNELRKEWNKHAPSDIASVTETYREVIERRKRYADIKSKIANGEIKEINDFITYNLNIRQFVQDVLETTGDAGFCRSFYQALLRITILDPTCGSGAFLFAAMNILELLYEACIQRMRSFVDESGKGKHKYFEETLAQVNAPEHPNLQYFIYKSIILNNLYGVDIMNEAVEIAKLRMFLKLVATVDADYSKKNLGLEPLPDVDFNIRGGNTLIGYATEAQLNEAFVGTQSSMLDFDDDKKKIEEQCDTVARAFARYKEIQLKGHTDFGDFKTAKDDLNDRLDKLRNELNQLLHKQHYPTVKYDRWLATHQPFHWFAEFYEIVQGRGGFDVVIGNPPYIEYSAVKRVYSLTNYHSLSAGNLYSYVIEKGFTIMHPQSRIGMIIQMSAFCTPRMKDFQDVWFNNSQQCFLSFFDDRPGKLFDGLQHIRVVICIAECSRNSSTIIGTSNYIKFLTEFRPTLFEYLHYEQNGNSKKGTSILKVNSKSEQGIVEKIWSSNKCLSYYLSETINNNFVYYGYGYGYFGKILNFKSFFKGENVKTSTGDKYIYVSKDYDRDIVVALMNSTLFYWFYVNYSDGHNFTKHVFG